MPSAIITILGVLTVSIIPNEWCIKNTGAVPLLPADQLFGYFRKGNISLDSIGIGLAIVKKICELYGCFIEYNYNDNIPFVADIPDNLQIWLDAFSFRFQLAYRVNGEGKVYTPNLIQNQYLFANRLPS